MRFKIALVALITLALFMACGEKKEAADDSANDAKKEVINLTGNDQMQYNLKTIEVSAGSTVRVNLKHIGQMAKTVMGHNFVLLKKNVDMAEFATAAINAKDHDYIPQDKKDQIIAHTSLVGGGESTFVEFTAPAPGTYTFLCTFPGHYVTMHGDFIVK